jgi:hypothetical protein
MGLAQQFLAGRSPHRVLVGDQPLDTNFSEALERAAIARAKNEFGLIENAMDEEGALARTQNVARQQRQLQLEAEQYKEAAALAQAKAEGTDAIIDAIFPDPQEKFDQYYENKKTIKESKVENALDKLILNRTSIENQRAQILNAQDATELNSIRTDNFLDSLDSDSIKMSTD